MPVPKCAQTLEYLGWSSHGCVKTTRWSRTKPFLLEMLILGWNFHSPSKNTNPVPCFLQPEMGQFEKKTLSIEYCKGYWNLRGSNSAFVIGFYWKPILRLHKHYFLVHFGATKITATKARRLKHDFPFTGNPNLEFFILASQDWSVLTSPESFGRPYLKTLLFSIPL